MLLSVVVYNHKLSRGQWLGAGVVFAGISVEAFVKRTGQFDGIPRLACILIAPCRCTSETRYRGERKGDYQDFVITDSLKDSLPLGGRFIDAFKLR
jgi:hypothetical protein